MKTNSDSRSFVIFEGTPTLTLVSEGIQRMLPYHTFSRGRFEGKRLTLHFGDLLITIEGDSLDELWEGLQLQDVRSIRCQMSNAAIAGECVVQRISIRNASDASPP